LQGLYKIREKFDSCSDKIGPSVIVTIEPVWKELIEIKKRAGKIRLLTEITKDNIPFCKELMKIGELRHFDGVKVNFAILDGKEYQATIIHEESEPVTQLIVSNAKSFVDQHQYVFDTLWSRAIPGEQKIKEIQEGIRPDFADVIHDYKEIQKINFNLIKSAKKEILVLFLTINAFHQHTQLMQLFKEAAKERGVKIRIMMPAANEINDAIDVLKEQQQINIQYLKKSFQTNVTVFVVDNVFSLTVESKCDREENTKATYSNIESTAISYASIFETLWIEPPRPS
jgi:two-component system, OmpR family, sensor histidine kinase VicK